jgi:uncharacterized protein
VKPLRTRLQGERNRLGIPWAVLERDYLLSWILAGMMRIPSLRSSLVFKGGTALKKCYFGDYRFSEDLDFSTVGAAPTGRELAEAMSAACVSAATLLDEYAPVEILCARYSEKEPHPGAQEAFNIRARFPWQREPLTRVMVEVTMDERVLVAPAEKSVMHGYGEALVARILVYSLEEIVAEKLRAILQHGKKLRERGWSRSRARDYYDLWRILSVREPAFEPEEFGLLLRKKCAARDVAFSSEHDFFEATTLSHVEKTWEQWLGPLVHKLPGFSSVISELRPMIAGLLLG